MKFLLSCAPLLLLAGCSPSAEIPIEEIEIVGVSGHPELIYVYFQPPAGVECAGVHIEESGTTRTLSFLRAGACSPDQVTSAAVPSEDPVWEGCLRVEVEIPEGARKEGGELILKYAGRAGYANTWTFAPPDEES